MKTVTSQEITEKCRYSFFEGRDEWRGTALDLLKLKECDLRGRLYMILKPLFVNDRFKYTFGLWCAEEVQHLVVDEQSKFRLEFLRAYCEWRFLSDDADWIALWEKERIAALKSHLKAKRARRKIPRAEDDAMTSIHAALMGEAHPAAVIAINAVRALGSSEKLEAAITRKLRRMLVAGVATGDVA